jgi:hypothetical protein
VANPLTLTVQPKPKQFVPKEYDEQCIVFDWARRFCNLDGIDMMYATMNGVRLPIGLARKMKRAGLKPGPLDINIDVARRGYHGLRIEMKRLKGGVLSDVQKDWIERLNAEGYLAYVCRGAQEAIDEIKWYLDSEQ